jgi:hypothetical protein
MPVAISSTMQFERRVIYIHSGTIGLFEITLLRVFQEEETHCLRRRQGKQE